MSRPSSLLNTVSSNDAGYHTNPTTPPPSHQVTNYNLRLSHRKKIRTEKKAMDGKGTKHVPSRNKHENENHQEIVRAADEKCKEDTTTFFGPMTTSSLLEFAGGDVCETNTIISESSSSSIIQKHTTADDDEESQEEESRLPYKNLSNLLQSCKVITTTALSCHTLGATTANKQHKQQSDSCTTTISISDEISNEMQLGSWLTSQINDYRAALSRKNQQLQIITTASTNEQSPQETIHPNHRNNRESIQARKKRNIHHQQQHREEQLNLKRLREELFDQTIRDQQQKLLLKRMSMSAASVFTTFPEYAKLKTQPPPHQEDNNNPSGSSSSGSGGTGKSNNRVGFALEGFRPRASSSSMGSYGTYKGAHCHHDDDENDDSAALYLRREALRARDDLAINTLETMKQVTQLQIKYSALSNECQSYQSKNRELWNTCLAFKKKRANAEDTSNDDEDEDENDCNIAAARHKKKENQLLKHALLNTILGSGIDWYSNPRLRETVMKLEK